MAFEKFMSMFGKKSEPAEEPDYDNSYYGTDVNGTVSEGDDDGIHVVSTEALEKEPLLKRTFTPQGYDDRKAIVDAFKDGRVVVLCIEELDMSAFYRIFDYVMGAVQALDGEAVRIDRETVVLLPYGAGEVSIDELEEEEFEEEEETETSDDEE